MLGGFVAATNLVSMENIEKGAEFILGKKMPEETLKLNIKAIQLAYEEVKNA